MLRPCISPVSKLVRLLSAEQAVKMFTACGVSAGKGDAFSTIIAVFLKIGVCPHVGSRDHLCLTVSKYGKRHAPTCNLVLHDRFTSARGGGMVIRARAAL